MGVLGPDGRRRQRVDRGKAPAIEVLNSAIAFPCLLFMTPVL
jgi:hypothetical protein